MRQLSTPEQSPSAVAWPTSWNRSPDDASCWAQILKMNLEKYYNGNLIQEEIRVDTDETTGFSV